jgi:glyoxylase-like metal-dependent hydrolase (beta-lactamase superfamily II)
MKKPTKPFFYKLFVAISGVVLLGLGYLLVARLITRGMSPVETGEPVKNVYSVKDSFVNLYLVKNGEHYVAIDAGNDKSTVQQELKKLNIGPDKITVVLLTHTDRDHVAGIPLFKKADIYLSKQEEQMLSGKKSRFLVFVNKIDSKLYKLIDDQQIMNIGGMKIQGFLTPGHTPGSMCYLVNDTLLFTGDALRLTRGKVDTFYSFFNMDTEKATQSIAKIIRIPGVRYLFTAHNGYTDNFNSATKDWPLDR